MQIVLPSNVTSVTVSKVKMDWVFSLAGNTVHGSTGLTANWLCKYDYHATPSVPRLLFAANVSTDSIVIQWAPLTCDVDNKARVLSYVIQRLNNVTGKLQSLH